MKTKAVSFIQQRKQYMLLMATSIVLLASFLIKPALAEGKGIDYKSFLNQHDMTWDRTPNCWQVAPFSGNGNVGFLFFQKSKYAKNQIGLHVGRHDYYDHREPHNGKQMPWIYTCRLPLGHFILESEGDILSTDLRLDLWNSELRGTVKTSKGSYKIHALTHTLTDVIFFETDVVSNEKVKISWHPEAPYSSVKTVFNEGGGPKGSDYWDQMRKAPYPLAPEPILSTKDNIHYCLQKLHLHRGETTTGWEITGESDGKQLLTTSIHHSFPEKNSLETVRKTLEQARLDLKEKTFFSKHQEWWHAYYPQSFLTVNDAEKEAFYWIQMYKLASATRGNGPILDLMGPWYNKTFWPMVWGDLNVQLIYWTHLTANRLNAGESLVNNIDKYSATLESNAPDKWKDSATLGALFPQNMDSKNAFPDMLVWLLHDYWLHCEYAGDRDRMRDKLFPILKKSVNSYRNYIEENPVDSEGDTIHIKHSWSPEYPGGRGQDINFTIALIRWSCQTLLDLNDEHQLNDSLATEWQNILDNLVDYQIDENGLRIGKDIAFAKPHRHYSHLLAFYPLAEITPEAEKDKKLLKTSVDHWLDITLNSGIKVKSMPATGYTCTGATSMYAWLGDGETANKYLNMFIQHPGVAPTTMYAEVTYNPVIESPLSYATSMHDMLLQSWGGKIRIFSGIPKSWSDVAFQDFRTEGAFLVSAKREAGVTRFVKITSEIGSPCIVKTDIKEPKIYINNALADQSKIKMTAQGLYEVQLEKSETVIFTPTELEKTNLVIQPLPVDEQQQNLFGLNKKTERLPGHQNYYLKGLSESR